MKKMLNWVPQKKVQRKPEIEITEIKTEIFPSTRKNIPLMKPHQIHTWMGRIGLVVNHAIVWLLLVQLHKCSEFPERECCDPIYPSIPELELLPPAQQTTTISSSSSISAGTGNLGNTGRSGECTMILHHQSNQLVHRWMCLLHSKMKKEKSFIQFNTSREISRSVAILNLHFESQKFVSFSSALMDINLILKLFSTIAASGEERMGIRGKNFLDARK